MIPPPLLRVNRCLLKIFKMTLFNTLRMILMKPRTILYMKPRTILYMKPRTILYRKPTVILYMKPRMILYMTPRRMIQYMKMPYSRDNFALYNPCLQLCFYLSPVKESFVCISEIYRFNLYSIPLLKEE